MSVEVMEVLLEVRGKRQAEAIAESNSAGYSI